MEAEKRAERRAHTSPTVLVVEDDLLVRIAVGEFLRDCGFEVIEVGSAAEASTVLDSDTFHVDVLFTDIRLPGPMDGFGLAQWARINKPGVKTILTSGLPQMSEDAGILGVGGAFLEKPFELPELEGRIRMLLGERDGRAAE